MCACRPSKPERHAAVTATIIATRHAVGDCSGKAFLDVRASDETVTVESGVFQTRCGYTALLDGGYSARSRRSRRLDLETFWWIRRQRWLIDFALTRDGHTLYDFARLETELVRAHRATHGRAGLAAPELTRVLAWRIAANGRCSGARSRTLDDAAGCCVRAAHRNRCLSIPRTGEYRGRCCLQLARSNRHWICSEAPPPTAGVCAAAYLASK